MNLSPRLPSARTWRSQLLWAVLLAVISWGYQRVRRGSSIFLPPYCAWRFVGNGDAWNVAFPDGQSIYHVIQMKIDEGDMLKIVADSFPYARYMSYQTYDLTTLTALKSLRDVDIVPDNGPNLYNNLTAAARGEKQGGYTMYITPHGDQNYTNELRLLPDHKTTGHVDLFFRIYLEEEKEGPEQAPWGHKDAYGPEFAYEWGWAPPPRVWIKRKALSDEWKELPFCRFRRRTGFSFMPYIADKMKPPPNLIREGLPAAPNMPDNVFLPSPTDLSGKFASKDSYYIASLAESRDTTAERPLFLARISGVLPRTAGGLYRPPLVANATDYHVRYASINSGQRTVPFRNFDTASDTAITRHYRKRHGADWDGSYVVWVVPKDLKKKDFPPAIMKDDGLVLIWGQDAYVKKPVKYGGILWRQVMAQSQVLPEEPLHASGIVNIVPEACPQDMRSVVARNEAARRLRLGQASTEELLEDVEALEPLCCGDGAPAACFEPAFVAHRMGPYYPRIEYYRAAPGGRDLERL